MHATDMPIPRRKRRADAAREDLSIAIHFYLLLAQMLQRDLDVLFLAFETENNFQIHCRF